MIIIDVADKRVVENAFTIRLQNAVALVVTLAVSRRVQ